MDGLAQSRPVPSTEQSGFVTSILSSPRGLKRSRNGQIREQRESDFPAIARGFASQAGDAQLRDADDVILQSEEIVARTDQASQDKRTDLEVAVHESAAQLARLWKDNNDPDTKEGGVGPASDGGFDRASYIASLLLQLYHPHTYDPPKPTQAKLAASKRRPTLSACHLPRALLDWLEAYHNPFPDDYNAIITNGPSAAAHDRFWDIVYASLSRGKLKRTVRLLRDAGWEHAATAADDNLPQGYSDRQLDSIEEAVERCVKVIETCPAIQYDDWDVKGGDWEAFRQRIRQALINLERFAAEDQVPAANQDDRGNMFQVSARKRGEDLSMSAASQRAESKVPWSIYENLKLVYGQLLGSAEELLDTSQDWLEATIFLTVWWDGEEDAGLGRSSLRKSKSHRQKTREVDISPLSAYRRRLADSFALATEAEEDMFVVDSSDPVQVALVCAIEDSVESAIALLRTWSLPITTAVVELAALGGWLPQARPRSRGLLEQGFNEEDLMVLSHGPDSQPKPGEVGRDAILAEYADLLAERDIFSSGDGKANREGWELAVAVLNRRDDEDGSRTKIEEILDRIELSNEERVDKVLAVCGSLDLTEQGRGIAEVSYCILHRREL